MPRNSNGQGTGARTWRIVLIALAAANAVALGLYFFPPGGSADELEQQLASLRSQVGARRVQLARTREHAAAVEKGRQEGGKFLGQYFLSQRTAYSTLLSELVTAADEAKIKPKEHAYATEPIEGSDNLDLMTITANYEGTYANLMKFVHAIDQSPRLLIIEGLTATPQQGAGTLNVSMKIDAFVREDAGAAIPAQSASVGDDSGRVSQ